MLSDISRRTSNAERKQCYPVSRPGSAAAGSSDTADRDAFYSLLKSGQEADISRLGAIRSRLGRRDFERVCRESKVLPLAFFLDKTESTHVSYKGYNMGSDLAKAFAKVLQSAPHPLASLNLSDNAIAGAGSLAVSKALKRHPELTHLDISKNRWSDDAVEVCHLQLI